MHAIRRVPFVVVLGIVVSMTPIGLAASAPAVQPSSAPLGPLHACDAQLLCVSVTVPSLYLGPCPSTPSARLLMPLVAIGRPVSHILPPMTRAQTWREIPGELHRPGWQRIRLTLWSTHGRNACTRGDSRKQVLFPSEELSPCKALPACHTSRLLLYPRTLWHPLSL